MTGRNTEPRRCCVCDRREKPTENFDAHEMACIRGRAIGSFRMNDEARRSDLIDIACTVVGETDKAWRVDGGDDKPVWLPKSQCEIERGKPGGVDTLTLPEWLAKERGLI